MHTKNLTKQISQSPTTCFLQRLHRRAKATRSTHGSALRWHNDSNLFDFHELRQDFNPPYNANASHLTTRTNPLKKFHPLDKIRLIN